MKRLDPGKIERILIRGTNWVGDAVMSIPAMREIRRIFPRASISLLVRPWVSDVYAAVDFVDEVLTYDKAAEHSGWKGRRLLISGLRERRFDLAILLQNALEAAYIAWRSRIPNRLGYPRDGRRLLLTHPIPLDPEAGKVHQVYYYLALLAGAGWLPHRLWEDRGYSPSLKIGVREADRAAARALLEANGVGERDGIVALNPGAAYGGAKRWLSDRYAAVADALAGEYGVRIIILGAPNETGIAGEVARRMNRPAVILTGKTTLGELMGLIRECRLFITNDSGPMHLAAALDVPQLAIFGSTSEIATGPLSAAARVVKHPVDCNPCFLRECPIDFRCMTGISVERVLAEAREKLEESESP